LFATWLDTFPEEGDRRKKGGVGEKYALHGIFPLENNVDGQLILSKTANIELDKIFFEIPLTHQCNI